jgi:hypothetical protein
MDVLRTRLQTQHHASSVGNGKKFSSNEAGNLAGKAEFETSEIVRDAKYRDVRHAIREIYKGEGLGGFYRGIVTRVIFVSPGVAISWGTYEIFKSLFKE